MEPAAAGALYAAENFLSGAAAIIKGITYPTLPLTANLTHITSVPLPRSGHTLSVVKGRAYIFGGEAAPGQLADNDMHIVILPSSGVQEADYTTVNAKPQTPGGEVPAGRKGHTAVVVGDNIYVFGGEGVEPENGRVWIYDTVRNKWSYLDPASDTLFPNHRSGHASVSSDFPPPKDVTYKEKTPQRPADPAKVVPEPADTDSWGTVFVVGGKDIKTGELLTDALAFDIRSRTWSNIPSPSGSPVEGASLALVGNILYRYGDTPSPASEITAAESTVYHLDVSSVWKHAEGGTTPLKSGWSWEPVSPPSPTTTSTDTSPAQTPHARAYAGLIPLTTGQGRNYLLLLNGSSPAPNNNTTLLDDIWAFQLPPEKSTAAATKDVLRAGLKRDTNEARWAEVKYTYVDAMGDAEEGKVEGEKAGLGGDIKGLGSRGEFAAARGTEVDGASCVVWGGLDAEGRVLGDGWLITIER